MRYSNKIAYILGSFPGGCSPFIINEIKGLTDEGIDIIVFPVHKTNITNVGISSGGICAVYADPIFSLKIIVAHLYFILRRPIEYCRILIKNRSFGGKRVFCEAAYYAKIIRRLGIKHVHAHFAWQAADCARIVKRLSGIPFSLTAHQSDIHRKPERLYEKLSEAKFVLTCTRGNKEYLAYKYNDEVGTKIFTVYHGTDIDRFSPGHTGDTQDIDILSIGSLITVKGFEYLIKACAELKENELFKKCVIVGQGEEKGNLDSLINELGLVGKVEIIDPVPYIEIANLYRRATIFVLPVTVINGAPHGIPNVIAEAMAMGLPVIAFNVPHIPELIENDKNGFLIPDKDPDRLAQVIEKLLSDAELRYRVGRSARERIINDFDVKKNVQSIAKLFIQGI